jgi:hypothetical protein
VKPDFTFDVVGAEEYERLRVIERIDGVKTYARGYLSDADGRTVEADGVFIQPAWARDAG